jgi:hypothetical protein
MEQEDRHQRFSDTPYSLEANCKEGPGGLRDLQLILWIAQAAGYGKCWNDLEQRGFITDEEEAASRACEAFLRRLRITPAPARRTPRRSPALRVPDRPGRTARLHRHCRQPVQRATDAGVLPDRQNGDPDQCDRPAEHRCRACSRFRTSRRSRSTNASRMTHEFLDVVHEDVFKSKPRVPSSRPSCCSRNMPT